jgi:hypothetical protein
MSGMNRVHLVRHGEADYGPINDHGWPGLASELAPQVELELRDWLPGSVHRCLPDLAAHDA